MAAPVMMVEQLAMYMTSLPCPPLPIKLPYIDEKTGKNKITSSHDILAGVLVSAMVRGNSELNGERKKRQIEITRTLLDKSLISTNADSMYDICKEFTAEYLHSFDDKGTCTPGAAFLEMHEVEKGDDVHKAISSWHAAQDILHRPPAQQRKAEVFARLSYEKLMELHWVRVRDGPTDILFVDAPPPATE